MISYNSALPLANEAFKPAVLLETSYTSISFPTVMLPVHSYIGDMMKKEAPESIEEFMLLPFSMKVQGIDRTLADKIFAVCDYYLQNKVQKHSRHIYDIYKLIPHVPQLLEQIIEEQAYKKDYDNLTTQLLEEQIPYDVAINSLKEIAHSDIF